MSKQLRRCDQNTITSIGVFIYIPTNLMTVLYTDTLIKIWF